MNPANHAIDRLFRAAARDASRFGTADTPVLTPALEARILATRHQWLSGRASDDFSAVLAILRRGLAVAMLAAAVTVLVCHRLDDRRFPAIDSVLVESVAELSLLP